MPDVFQIETVHRLAGRPDLRNRPRVPDRLRRMDAPPEGENVAALESRIRELEAEVSRLHIDHERVADADRLFANLADNQGIVSRRAEAPSARPL